MPPHPQPTIESATAEDVDTLVEHWLDLATDQREYGSYVLPEANRETIRETLEAYRFGDGLLVARLDGEVVGFASVSLERGSFALEATRGLLSNLYVRPDRRGEGIGAELLEAAENRLIEQGAEVVILEAMADNESARRFYRRHGYEEFRVGMERRVGDRTESDTH